MIVALGVELGVSRWLPSLGVTVVDWFWMTLYGVVVASLNGVALAVPILFNETVEYCERRVPGHRYPRGHSPHRCEGG